MYKIRGVPVGTAGVRTMIAAVANWAVVMECAPQVTDAVDNMGRARMTSAKHQDACSAAGRCYDPRRGDR